MYVESRGVKHPMVIHAERHYIYVSRKPPLEGAVAHTGAHDDLAQGQADREHP